MNKKHLIDEAVTNKFDCLAYEMFHGKIFTLLTYIYIFLLFYFTIHLIMTEAGSKRRVLPLVLIVKSFTKSLLVMI